MNAFTEDYFLRGQESGLSNFTNYKWMPDASIAWAVAFKRYLGIDEGDRVLDVGAARGYYVKALRMLGVEAYGYDISEWAVENCHPDVKPYMSNHINGVNFDFIYSKDCFEHVPKEDLAFLVKHLLARVHRKMFVIVPLAKETGGEYVHPKEEKDSTHVNRWTLPDWLAFFGSLTNSFVITGGYRYPQLKPGAYEVEQGYGFITLEKV
jgi:hypothetical protein